MRLVIYYQSSYQKTLVELITNSLRQDAFSEENVNVSIVFDEFASLVASSSVIVTINKRQSGKLVISSERSQKKGSRHTGRTFFNHLVKQTEPDLVAIDRRSLEPALNLSVCSFKRNITDPNLPDKTSELQHHLSHQFSVFVNNHSNIANQKKAKVQELTSQSNYVQQQTSFSQYKFVN